VDEKDAAGEGEGEGEGEGWMKLSFVL